MFRCTDARSQWDAQRIGVSKDKSGLTIIFLLSFFQKGLCFLLATFQFHFDLRCSSLTHFPALQRKPAVKRMGNEHVKSTYLTTWSEMGKEYMHPDVCECALI